MVRTVRLGTEKREADDWWHFVGVEWLQRRHGRAKTQDCSNGRFLTVEDLTADHQTLDQKQ